MHDALKGPFMFQGQFGSTALKFTEIVRFAMAISVTVLFPRLIMAQVQSHGPTTSGVSEALAVNSPAASNQTKPMCVLAFDCNDVEKVTFKPLLPEKECRLRELPCTNNTLRLMEGRYQIDEIHFRGGLRIIYKSKIVDLIPGQTTLITFSKPTNDNLTVKKQGTYYSIEYNPKAYWDEEFYYNPDHPPVLEVHHNGRPILSQTFAYG